MINYKYLIALLFVLTLVMGMTTASLVRAQSEDGWTDPVNLSNSGLSIIPSMVIDSKGTVHVFWLDKIDGYKYANSADGVTWSEPKTIETPFSADLTQPVKPVFLAGPDGTIHILWQDTLGALQYSRATAATLGTPSSWTGNFTLAEKTVQFDAVIDSQGALHIGYINKLQEPEVHAGIYYRRLDGSGWSPSMAIYPSRYYRSLTPEDDANIQLATSSADDGVNVYIAWDDRTQKRIFLAKSLDGGKAWDGTFEVRGPQDFSGLEMPFNIDLGAAGEQVLLVWQVGIPGEQCAQYSQWSTDGAKQFGQPLKMLGEFARCPQNNQFLLSDQDFSVLLLSTFDDLSLMAWDGSRWSSQMTQSSIASFVNPVSLESVFLGCQNTSYYEGKVYIVGCDTGTGGDIWFSSRPIGSTEEWFPPPSTWSAPVTVTSTDQKISTLLSIADQNDRIHDIWVQNPNGGGKESLIQYSRWDGTTWSDPATIISGSQINPSQLTLSIDSLGKLLLAWVDDSTGDMFFTWANSEHANSASEWEKPVYIPSASSENSSPDILMDASSRMIVAYAVPINEERGIYIVESDDLGTNWLKPIRVFDASAANWSMVDQPKIALTGDGRLHILFGRYSLHGEQRNSLGLYYIQSSDGGVTWSQPVLISEQPVQWSELIASGESTLHQIWQEQRLSNLVSLHQYSTDGGTTWSQPATLSNLSDSFVLNHVSSDLFENLYFLQMTGPEETTVVDQKWDKTGWKIQEHKALDLNTDSWNPSSIVSSISPSGDLVASVLINSSDEDAKWQSEIQSLAQNLEFSGQVPTSFPASITFPDPALAGTQQVAEMSDTLTPESPLANIPNTESFLSKNRNLVGLMLMGAVLVFLALILLASSRPGKKVK